ncbi:MAG: CbtA family protein, partial [Candidatus Nitrosocosmicus sp.]|nr:CbtA family protein [Candidatus Nitrosocosmicus sp.]
YVVPFIKYPANPPAVGDPETIDLRASLYTGFQLVSGLITLGLAVLLFKIRNIRYVVYLIPIIYLGLIAFIYAIFPANPDEITAPMDLVNAFRAVTFGTMVMFFLILGGIFGIMWNKFRPQEITKAATAT